MVVGIDVSKDCFDASWQDSEKTYTQRFPYTDKGIGDLQRQTSKTAVFVMEATGTYHSRLPQIMGTIQRGSSKTSASTWLAG